MEKFFQFEKSNSIEFLRIFLPGAWAVLSTRHGGVSRPPFSTLNMAYHVGDDRTAVADNRNIFAEAVGISLDNTVCANQVHGTKIAVVGARERGKGVLKQEDAVAETDALITVEKGVILAGFFADCVPIYIADPVKDVIALVHAGWKGTVNGIAGKTIRKMSEVFACTPSDCYAVIGPSIGPCCYTVGEEFLAEFNRGLDYASFMIKKQDQWMFDLWAANENNLLSAGVLPEHIGVSGICTKCDSRFFSYRGDGNRTGRMAAFIRLL